MMPSASPELVAPADSFPNDPCLADMIRSAAARVYAEAQLNDAGTLMCHRNRISSMVGARLGAGLACDVSREYLSTLFDLLVTIGDLAHVGDGNYVPRESRVTIFVDGWGRISGGLPSECFISGESIADHLEGGPTIGRMVKLATGVAGLVPEEWEVHDTYFWSRSSDQELYAHLLENSVGARCPAVTDPCVFYDAVRRGKIRRHRWIGRMVDSSEFVVARRIGPPYSNYVVLVGATNDAQEWYEVSSDDARKWVLLSERIAKVKNYIRSTQASEYILVGVPDMLPGFATVALTSCACAVTRTDGMWDLRINTQLHGFLDTILPHYNLVLS